MHVPSSIPFVLSKIWPGHASIMKNWLWGDNSVNIQDRIMVFGTLPFPSLLSIYKPSFISIQFVQDIAQTGIPYEKWLWGDNSINRQGRIVPLLPSIYKPSFT